MLGEEKPQNPNTPNKRTEPQRAEHEMVHGLGKHNLKVLNMTSL